jgi:hypothetical protein
MALNSELTQDHEDRAPVGGCGGGWWWHTPTDTIDKGDADVLARDTWVIGSVIAGLASVPLLPFRFDQTLAAFARHLATWQEKAGTRFDLGPVMEHTEALRIRVADLQDRLNTVPEKRLAAVNRSLMRLARILNPVLYTRVGRFGQDRAVPHPFVPGLQEIDELEGAGDREGFLRTRLVRERNRIQDALFQVERELESLESSLA